MPRKIGGVLVVEGAYEMFGERPVNQRRIDLDSKSTLVQKVVRVPDRVWFVRASRVQARKKALEASYEGRNLAGAGP